MAGALSVGLAPSCMSHPAPLDLSKYRLTFEDKFNSLSISSRGPGTRWTAHTPWYGDFGDAQFADPENGFPFTAGPGGLRIEARKEGNGRWRSGLICSVDKDVPGQQGFSQQFGYFEMRAKLPVGPGVWAAFWLIGVDKSRTSSEIDVVEFYGHAPGFYKVTYHLWTPDHKDSWRDTTVSVPEQLIRNQYNDFGVSIDADQTIAYFNKLPVWSQPTRPEYHQPMYMLANLALGGGWPIDKLTSPQFMHIEHIRAYQLL